MNLSESITLAGYIRQAEHYGTEEVFETALDDGLDWEDLGKLALRLQNLDPKWKLTVDAQRLFVLTLTDYRQYKLYDAARMAGVSRPTARQWFDTYLLEDHDNESPGLALRAASKDRFASLKGIVRGWHRTG